MGAFGDSHRLGCSSKIESSDGFSLAQRLGPSFFITFKHWMERLNWVNQSFGFGFGCRCWLRTLELLTHMPSQAAQCM